MARIPSEQVSKAKEMDLLTYLQSYEPQELVHFSGNTYCTREHDSLKISNGKWFWFSRGIGGRSALDYLVKVRQVPFTDAVAMILGQAAVQPPVFSSQMQQKQEKIFRLPAKNRDNRKAISYLEGRGIDREVIRFFISKGQIFENYPQHSAVFVGCDEAGTPKYAAIRGIGNDFKGESSGSDKRFSFRLSAENSDTIHLFESAIDLLSFVTMAKISGRNWKAHHLLSLAGVYQPGKNSQKISVPPALSQFLRSHSEIKRIVLRLDNDPAGRSAAQALETALGEKYQVKTILPPEGKDYNDCLCIRLGLSKAKPPPGQER